MSWSDVRASIESTIEALTPTTATYGSRAYRHIEKGTVEYSSKDREFLIRVNSRQRIGEVTTGTTRYLTDIEIVIRYMPTVTARADEVRIQEDYEQLQAALLTLGNHHSDVAGFHDAGGGLCPMSVTEDDDRNYTVVLSMSIHHT